MIAMLLKQTSIRCFVLLISTVLLTLSQSAKADISTDLYGHWHLDGNKEDVSGNNNDLSQVGANVSLSATGKYGQGCLLTNTDPAARGLIYRNIDFTTTHDLTIAGWIRPTTLADGTGTTTPHTVFHIYELQTTGTVGNSLKVQIKDHKLMVSSNLLVTPHISTVNIAADTWSFVALVVTENEMRLYYNSQTPEIIALGGRQSYNRFFIGLNENNATLPQGYNGMVDEIRLFRRALSTSDIGEVYEYSYDIGLWGQWHLNGDRVDSSGYGHDLNMLGDRTVVSGVQGQGYLLTNTDPAVRNTMYYNTDFVQGTSITFTAWIRPALLENGESQTAPHSIIHFYRLNDLPDLNFYIKDGLLGVSYYGLANPVLSSLTIAQNEWTFVAVTVGTGELRICKNNEIPQVFSVTSQNGVYTNRMFIGVSANSSTNPRGFTGRIDEIRVYTRVLSDQEILNYYEQDFPVNAAQNWTLY